jgi:hypothetical protein
MTMLAGFAPSARQAIIRAGMLSADARREVLSTDMMLLGLAETGPLSVAADSVTAVGVRAEIEDLHDQPQRDQELLAALGIDLEEVRRRVGEATSMHRDDFALWQLRRSRIRPLRVTLRGPGIEIPLDEGGRKVIEVARWAGGRGQRTVAGREDLLWGLLADGSNASVHIMKRLNVDLREVWADLHRRNTAA